MFTLPPPSPVRPIEALVARAIDTFSIAAALDAYDTFGLKKMFPHSAYKAMEEAGAIRAADGPLMAAEATRAIEAYQKMCGEVALLAHAVKRQRHEVLSLLYDPDITPRAEAIMDGLTLLAGTVYLAMREAFRVRGSHFDRALSMRKEGFVRRRAG